MAHAGETPPQKTAPAPAPLSLMSRIIFGSRWLQLPLYLGLIVAQMRLRLSSSSRSWSTSSMHATRRSPSSRPCLIVLGLIDVVMISNLLVMVIVGGYETFVSRHQSDQGHPDQPEWLSHVNASVLKIKLAMAIIGISSIHLLRTFIEAGNIGSANRSTEYTETGIILQTAIHTIFILSAIGIAWVDRMTVSTTGKAH